jgi:hypothetical protein
MDGGISPSQGHYLHGTAKHRKTRTHIHASSRIRTHGPSIRAVEDRTCLRKHGPWDLFRCNLTHEIFVPSIVCTSAMKNLYFLIFRNPSTHQDNGEYFNTHLLVFKFQQTVTCTFFPGLYYPELICAHALTNLLHSRSSKAHHLYSYSPLTGIDGRVF